MARAIGRVFRRLGLRFPTLFVILLVVTLADFVIPDAIPFVDEIVLASLTAIFGLWKERRTPPGGVVPPARNLDPTKKV